MNRLLLGALLTAGVTCLAGVALGKGFIEDRPWLADRSAWSESTDTQAAPAVRPGRHRFRRGGGGVAGLWALGNGRVFGIVGGGLEQAMISQITGPHIMLKGVMGDNAFGPSTLGLSVGGTPVGFAKQALSKVRGTNIVVMELTSDNVSMTVLNYAPFDTNAIFRTVVIKNTSKEPLKDVVLTGTVGRTKVMYGYLYDTFEGAVPIQGQPAQTRQMFCNFLEGAELAATSPPADNPNAPTTGTMTVKIGTLDPGAEAVRTAYLAFAMKEAGQGVVKNIISGGIKDLEKTRDDWKAWMANTTQLKCSDNRLTDLLDDTKTLVRIQTADPQGAAGPMEFFAGTWVRDSNGPFIYYCRMGNLDAAKKMLDFYYRGCAYSKLIPNFLPMDIDLKQPVDPQMDWTGVHNDPAEIPNWLIMQHRIYFQYTGDIEPIRAHWGYLKKCLMGQLQDDKGKPVHPMNWGSPGEPGPNTMYRFLHHGDETWIYPGFEVLNNPQVFPEPNDHPNWEQYSADSTWEFVMAADALADFAKRLGRTEEAKELAQIAKDSRIACERDYWMPERGMYAPAMDYRCLDIHQPPFAMVNFNPIWIGYLKPEDPHAASNVIGTMTYTMNPNYVTDVTETLRIYVGMQPGMFLYNLAAIDHPYADEALEAMMNVASPTGEYTEKHVTDPNSYQTAFLGHRIRPWEGGINCDAAYYYLTGLLPDMGNNHISLCPRMPEDWKEMSVTGQKLGDGKLDILVVDTGTKRTYTLKSSVSKAITSDFKISLPQSKFSSVKVDGKGVPVTPKNNWGLTTAKLNLTLAPGKTAVVEVAYAKEKVEPLKFERKRWEYIPPKVHPYKLVLWDYEPRKGNDPDFRTYNVLDKDKVDYRMVRFTTPANAQWLRPMLVKADGTLNTPLLLMGPTVLGPTLKFQTWWSDPELTKLLTDFMKAGGTIVAVNPGAPSSDFAGKLLGDSSFTTVPPANPPTPTPVEPTAEGKALWNVMGPLFTAEKKPLSARKFTFKDMVVLASNTGATPGAAILGKSYDKGTLVLIMVDLGYDQLAKLAEGLADPKALAEIHKSVSKDK